MYVLYIRVPLYAFLGTLNFKDFPKKNKLNQRNTKLIFVDTNINYFLYLNLLLLG